MGLMKFALEQQARPQQVRVSVFQIIKSKAKRFIHPFYLDWIKYGVHEEQLNLLESYYILF